MGLLICGNYGVDKTQEYETVSCPHCQQVKAITIKGFTKNIPYHHWCPRCRQPICLECAQAMQRLGQCPGPFVAKIEHANAVGEWNPNFVYQYHTTSR